MANNEQTKMNGEVSEKEGGNEPLTPELNVDNKQSLNTFTKKKTFNQKFLEEMNGRKDITTYDDIWSKGLPASFWDLKVLSEKNFNTTDITSVIYKSDYCDIQSWRAIENSKTDTTLYIPECGVWQEQKGYSMIRDLIMRFMRIMKKLVIDQIDLLIKNEKNDGDAVKYLEKRCAFYIKLYNYLGNRNQDTIIKRLVDQIVKETRDDDTFRVENFNKATGYIAFNDGVYSFEKKGLISYKEAMPLLFTKTTGYDYQRVLEVNDDKLNGCQKFVEQIIPNQGIRKWLLRRLNKSYASVLEKLILFWHGERGNNGKTKLLELLEMSLGESLFCPVDKSLLNEATFNNAGSSNEELMSLAGAVICAVSEPNKNKPLDMAVLKRISGGDKITGRRMYKGKERFKAKPLTIVACNSIPNIDDTDEASFERIRCVPFYSRFVKQNGLVNEEEHIYLMNEGISNFFDEWKYAFMKMVLESDEDVETPEEVLEHTKKYKEDEDVVSKFVSEYVEIAYDDKGKVDKKRYIARQDLWELYKNFFKHERDGKPVLRDFNSKITTVLDNYKEKTTVNTTKVSRVFLGYKVKGMIETDEHDDYD
jgi:P4 family phage/plasmid primase-like protien